MSIKDYAIWGLLPTDPEWPTGLWHLGTAMPEKLYGIGAPLSNEEPSLAVVGARAATGYGDHFTRQMVSDLGPKVTIVSGGAYGIDGAAHRQAVSQGGTTIAYMAGGADRVYPAGHTQLFEDILAHGGTILSEREPGATPDRWSFLQRNRLIAAHAQGVVVVEAGFRSGSLNAARHARDLGRPLGAVPGPTTSAASAGCHVLIREGATLIRSADDVRDMIRPSLGQED